MTKLPTGERTRSEQRCWAVAMIVTAAALCAFVGWHLIVPGPFDWHIAIPQAWQGGLEALALIVALAALQYLSSVRVRVVLMALLCALYLRRHAVDAPLVVSALYLEITIALGAVAMRLTAGRLPRDNQDYLQVFVLGFCLWSVFGWTASAFDFGTARDLRWLTLVLALVALPLARVRPLLGHLAREFAGLARGERALAAALLGWFCILFARTNVVTGFDALWYGLRGEYVLTADGSAFHSLAMVAPAQYVPKMYELYLQPLSGLGDYSPIVGITIGVGVLFGIAVAQLLAKLGVQDVRARLLAAITCLTIPALANPMLEPKPDVIAGLFVIIGCAAAIDWLRTREWPAFAWLFACALLATQAKLTPIPLVGILGIATLAHTFVRWRAPAAPTAALPPRTALAALALALVVAGFVTARTIVTAGVPTIGPDPLFKLWLALGFTLKEPAGSMAWSLPQDWSDVPALIADWLYRPERLEHIIITWTGNVWLWLPLAGALVGWRFGRHTRLSPEARTPVYALILSCAALALGVGYFARGGDGNYFIAGVVVATVTGIAYLWPRVAWSAPLRGAATMSLLTFALFQAAYAFHSANWGTGTRAFDLDFTRGVRDTRATNAALLEKGGIGRIAQYLRKLSRVPRVVGCADYASAVRLPARFEDLVTIDFSHRDYGHSPEKLHAYMSRFDVPYLLLRKETAETQKLKGTPQRITVEAPHGTCTPDSWTPDWAELVVDDDGYRLFKLIENSVPPK